MFSSSDFLAQECRNVRTLLQNTQRYNYSSDASGEIYRECHSRLDLIEHAFNILEDDELDELRELWNQLSKLSVLIGHLERSHIEEFSWPFARALDKLAADIYGRGDTTSPLVMFSSDNELSSYEVDTEQYVPGLRDRPLFSIKFPRSLKSFVLLHAILAHELGHAAYAIPQLSREIQNSVIGKLVLGSALSTVDELTTWVEGTKSNLPLEFSIDRAHARWPEELYCDLFGLLTIGPSYIGANESLLLPFDMKSVSSTHPPGLTRIWMLNEAVKHLGWKSLLSKPPIVRSAATTYFGQLEASAGTVPRRFRLLKAAQVYEAVDQLQKILAPMGATLFKLPGQQLLADMVNALLMQRPPVESRVDVKLRIHNEHVDFRWILLAGWLAWHATPSKKSPERFYDLNLLCERAVLLQCAVDHWQTNIGRRSVRRGSTKQ